MDDPKRDPQLEKHADEVVKLGIEALRGCAQDKEAFLKKHPELDFRIPRPES